MKFSRSVGEKVNVLNGKNRFFNYKHPQSSHSKATPRETRFNLTLKSSIKEENFNILIGFFSCHSMVFIHNFSFSLKSQSL